jgi:hypothetical protein
MIGDYYRPRSPFDCFPLPEKPPLDWDETKMRKLRELMDKAREMDDLMGEPQCEDPNKTAWMREIEERLKKLEVK